MPPVAFGDDTDPRRWGFQADSAAGDAVVGALHWPSSAPLSVGGVGLVALDKPDTYATGAPHTHGGLGSNSRLAIDESQRVPSAFRGGSDDFGSPGPRPMDPRIIVDSNGLGGSGGGGSGGGGQRLPSSRRRRRV